MESGKKNDVLMYKMMTRGGVCAGPTLLQEPITCSFVCSCDGPHPVHDEDLADVELVLELLRGNGHRVEETEAPVVKNSETERRMCSTEHQ